ncbi:uncharacterized protein C3orf38 homolog [Halyomorpha halys]|uniref:uncharacterized protein C3orf38 homolog n=1 Tax=Halyomorpha halys TaxID=286706 RepID=UPI0006D51D32|nr:uncharacterized protein C3orf38 homolog [Halyomorpha halys]
MISVNEQKCVREIVEFLQINDLLSLGATVTNNCIEIKTKEDAIKALLHEPSLRCLLTRKKITRNVLFKFLHSKDITFESTIDKNSLVDLAIKYCDQQKSETEIVLLGPAEAKILGYQFTEWFYKRLNVVVNQTEDEKLTEEDFWNDCHTTIVIPLSEDESHNSEANTAEDTLSLLKDLQSQYKLIFVPNLSPDGIKTVVETHGLVIVMVYGTLHSASGNCVGLFEQMFGLIKNPFKANNYKVKKMNLVLRNSSPVEPKMITN